MKNRVKKMTDELIDYIKENEGFRPYPYKDSKGVWTWLYGRNLEDNPITTEELLDFLERVKWKSNDEAIQFGEKLIRKDLESVVSDLEENLAFWNVLTSKYKTVLIDMTYNMGINKILMFKNMLRNIDNQYPEGVAYEILNSQYAKDVKTRALKNAKKIMDGHEDKYKDVLERIKISRPDVWKEIEKYV